MNPIAELDKKYPPFDSQIPHSCSPRTEIRTLIDYIEKLERRAAWIFLAGVGFGLLSAWLSR